MLTVVPSRRVAARIADAAMAAAEGTGLGSRAAWTADIVTLSDLVDRALAADPRPRRRLSRVGSALLAAEILRELEAGVRALFGPGIDGAGASRPVTAAIAEIRAAGLSAADLVPAARGSRRIAALAAVVDSWERRLEAGRLLDDAGAVARAARLVREGSWPAARLDALEVRDIYDVTRVQGELLLALARRAAQVRVRIPFEPRDPSATVYAYPYVHLWESVADPALDVQLEFFDDPDTIVPEVEFRPAADPAEEARRAAEDARHWIAEGIAPEEIAIVVPGPGHRLTALGRELARRGVPWHARRGAPALETPAAEAGLLPFWFLEEGLPRERMEAWVASPLTSALDPELLLPAIARGPVSGGTREEWNRALSAARGESAARLVAAIAAIDELGRAEAAPAEFWPRYAEVLSRVGLLSELAARDPGGLALWERALLDLRAAHETLGTWTAPARSWRVHRRTLIEALGEPRVQLGRQGRGVEVLTARDARGLPFRRQVLVGLVQGALTRQGAGSSILGDPERRLLNQALGRRAFRTSSEEAFESDLLLVERIRSTAETAILSWSVEDENATPLLPGLEVERERERRQVPTPAPPGPADLPAWRRHRGSGPVTALQELERGRTLFFSRPPATRRVAAGRADGAFDPGLVAALRQDVVAAPWSASALDSWGQCAHQYFQRYVLQLRPPDERPLEAEARTVGDLAHLALKRLFEEGGGPWDAERVRSAVDAAAESVRDHRRGAAAVWAVTRHRVAAILLRYLRTVTDAAPAGREPIALETSFGREGAPIPAVEIDTGYGPISLRGTIDRLDRDAASGDLHVIDYKYSFRGKDHAEAVDPERCGVDRFQLYAYFLGALAWEELDGRHRAGSVTAAIHCIKSASVAGPLIMPDARTVRGSIARAAESAAGGVFDPTPRDPARCRYCDFRRSCRIATVPGLAVDGDEVEE